EQQMPVSRSPSPSPCYASRHTGRHIASSGTRGGDRVTHSVLKLLCIFGAIALMGMSSLVPAAAQDPPAPAIDGITIDSYDCETGNLLFHVAVTDLPHIPDSNGPLGLSVIAHYEQGTDDGMPASGFNPYPEDSPYTGDVQFTRGI